MINELQLNPAFYLLTHCSDHEFNRPTLTRCGDRILPTSRGLGDWYIKKKKANFFLVLNHKLTEIVWFDLNV